ncbi:hypothetical protein B0H17DRAFT_1143683 [Mycena rosella]|uniref:Uncharacterized protein n=1 Tax=Mycena rosella TaxID=1033263 RepID=A0AAD7CVK5_MYCRO|nr:hypothetical protein B0H17DRAFT_1143683 [Mycena rosella]
MSESDYFVCLSAYRALPTAYSDARFVKSDLPFVEANTACRSTTTRSQASFALFPAQLIEDSRIQSKNGILDSSSPNRSTKAIFREDQGLLWLEIFSEAGVSQHELQSLHGQIDIDRNFGPLRGARIVFASPTILVAVGIPDTARWMAAVVSASYYIARIDLLASTTLTSRRKELYLDQPPSEPFLPVKGVPHIALSSEWRSRIGPLLISLETKTVTNLAPCPLAGLFQPEARMSYKVFRTDGSSRMLAARSLLNRPHELVMYDLKDNAEWVVLTDVQATEIIVVAASPRIKRTLAGLAAARRRAASTLAQQTLRWTWKTPLSLPDLDKTQALFGRIGDIDVKSLHSIYKYLIGAKLASPVAGKQFIEGFSQGGYLSFKSPAQCANDLASSDSVILRNPAVDLAAGFLHGSNIPEWAPNEALAAASPIHRVPEVTAATPVLLSADDRRLAWPGTTL